MVVDLFYFLNELDLLEIRLSILDDYVDKFILIEATETFSGLERELVYEKNKGRFKKWHNKIEYYVVSDYPMDSKLCDMALNSPNTGSGEHYWVREFYIKESAQKAIKGLNDNDIVFISDIDEIWNPKLTYAPQGKEVLKPKQLPYLYYLNQRTDEDWLGWSGTICTRYENIKNGVINHLRTDEMTPYVVLENGGWHFNAIGGKDEKRKAFKHPVYEDNGVWNNREVSMRKDETNLPEYILNNKDKWRKLLL